MKKTYVLVLCICTVLTACKEEKVTTLLSGQVVDWSAAHTYYKVHMDECLRLIDLLLQKPVTHPDTKKTFAALRIAFKKAEPYASYLNPPIGHRANGPALPVYLEDTGKVLEPFGLQKIAESIFDGGVSQQDFEKEVSLTRGLLVNLATTVREKPLNTQRFFIASHQQLLRIISFGISGFDTPVSHLGIAESAVSLDALKEVYEKSIASIIQERRPELDRQFKDHIARAVRFIERNTAFETFDRYTFIREHMNPITRDWVAIRKASGLWEGVNNKPFNFDAVTFFETDTWNTDYFVPPTHRNPSDTQIALGKKLFFDPKLSSNGTMACASCHRPEKAYADGLAVNVDNEGRPLSRNTPTLLNSIFQRSFFWDGRSPTLENQISAVFENEKEFNTKIHQFSDAILSDSTYTEQFKKAYGKIPQKNREVVRAISAYVATLNGFNSKFDRNMRGEEDTFTAEEQQGMNLFMGKALCATCHFMPLTNGTVPPFYNETEKEVIGVAQTAKNNKLDTDVGFFSQYQEELHMGMFKTPTVRNSALTAPYMHNGAYATLHEVMDFYNKGGGAGLGFDLPHQTLPFDELQLTDNEVDALVAFVKTLSDTKVDEPLPQLVTTSIERTDNIKKAPLP